MNDVTPAAGADLDAPPEQIIPDYSRVGFRQLQALCKARGIPADGKAPDLIEKLKLHDAQHGLEVDTDVDVLADDDDDEPDLPTTEPADEPTHPQAPPAHEQPVDGGEAASASPSAGLNLSVPPATTATSASPAVTVELGGLPPATLTKRGAYNTAVADGLVKVGDGYGNTVVRGFRASFTIGQHDVSDTDHQRFIAETHALAAAEGHQTKGGTTIGERVGYGTDENNVRTVIYQVPLRRQQ